MAETAEKGPTFSKILLSIFGQKKIHFETAFVRRVFSIYSMSFQKAGRFLKIISLPRSWLSWLFKSIPKLPRINTRKRTANKEITPDALIPKPTVLQPELRMIQDLCHWKLDVASFPGTPSLHKFDIRS
jgi:hypothetical protein